MTADGVDTYQIVKDANRYKWVYNFTSIIIYFTFWSTNKLMEFFLSPMILQGSKSNWRNLNYGSCWSNAFANEKPFPARWKRIRDRKRRLVLVLSFSLSKSFGNWKMRTDVDIVEWFINYLNLAMHRPFIELIRNYVKVQWVNFTQSLKSEMKTKLRL